MTKLPHFGDEGQARMVDVSAKAATRREAEASAFVALSPDVLAALDKNPKGHPLEVARFAGIQAAKRTSELIPMCHPLPLTLVDVTATVVAGGIAIRSFAATVSGTGVEMEALTAAAVAALTVYDMCKAVDRSMRIDGLRVTHKDGGKSGVFSQD
jgi:cyclic pyranopterin monophosphate synthase